MYWFSSTGKSIQLLIIWITAFILCSEKFAQSILRQQLLIAADRQDVSCPPLHLVIYKIKNTYFSLLCTEFVWTMFQELFFFLSLIFSACLFSLRNSTFLLKGKHKRPHLLFWFSEYIPKNTEAFENLLKVLGCNGKRKTLFWNKLVPTIFTAGCGYMRCWVCYKTQFKMMKVKVNSSKLG